MSHTLCPHSPFHGTAQQSHSRATICRCPSATTTYTRGANLTHGGATFVSGGRHPHSPAGTPQCSIYISWNAMVAGYLASEEFRVSMLAVCSLPLSSYGSAISLVEEPTKFSEDCFRTPGHCSTVYTDTLNSVTAKGSPTNPASLLELKANKPFQPLEKITHFDVTLHGEARKLLSLPVVARTEGR
jgi:hypothetical protein